MGSEKDSKVRQAIGCADLCELLAAAFSFPEESLAQALVDGSFKQDTAECLRDTGADTAAIDAIIGPLALFASCKSSELLGAMKKTYSLLYLAPGTHVPVFPYEAAFRFVAENREGSPTLFRSPVTLDVERHMQEAGVVAENARTEPCDSMFRELAFLSYLHAKRAEAIRVSNEADEMLWAERHAAFVAQHASRWLPAFMGQTIGASEAGSMGQEYAALARFAKGVLPFVASNINEDA